MGYKTDIGDVENQLFYTMDNPFKSKTEKMCLMWEGLFSAPPWSKKAHMERD